MSGPSDPLDPLARRSRTALEERPTPPTSAAVENIMRRAGRPQRRQLLALAVAVLIAVPVIGTMIRTPQPDVRFAPGAAPGEWTEVGREVFNNGSATGGLSGIATVGARTIVVGMDPGAPSGSLVRPNAWFSDDGRTWTPADLVEDGGVEYEDAGLYMQDVATLVRGATSRLVAVGYANFEPRTEPVVWLSDDDGSGWRMRRVSREGALSAVGVLNGRLVAVGHAGDLPAAWYSDNGEQWEPAQVLSPGGTFPGGLSDVASSGDRLVAVGHDRATGSTLWSSADGTSWEAAALPAIPEDAQLEISSVSASGIRGFFAAGTLATGGETTRNGVVLRSDDGRTWKLPDGGVGTIGGPGQQQLSAVDEHGGIAVGQSDRRATIWSAAGRSWDIEFSDPDPAVGGDTFSIAEEIFDTPAGLLVAGVTVHEAEGQQARLWLRPVAAPRPDRPPASTSEPAVPPDPGEAIGSFGGTNPLGPVVRDGVRVTASGHESGEVIAVDDATGVKRWTYDVGDTAFLGPIEDGTVLVAPQTGRVVALDLQTGERRWELALDTNEGAGAPTVHGDTLLLPTSFGSEGDTRAPHVRAVALSDGQVRWQTELEDGTDLQWAPPLVAGDLVLVADTFSHPRSARSSWLHALNRHTGEGVWRFDLKSRRQGFDDRQPLVGGGRVFVAAPRAPLFAIDLATGEELWRQAVPTFVRSMQLTAEGLHVRFEDSRRTFDPATGDPVG